MAINVQHIRVMNTSDGKMSLIIRTDILYKNEDKFCEVSTRIMKDGKEIVRGGTNRVWRMLHYVSEDAIFSWLNEQTLF